MSDVILLRTLSGKSTLKFGKYPDTPVSQLLEHKFGYLRWVYFNYSGITFSEDILEKLLPKDFLRIDKPGKDPEKYEVLLRNHFGNLFEYNFKKYKEANRMRQDYKKNELRRIVKKGHISKAELQRKNHGH
jgi:hypothetical protein